jgi:hypothetical protein
MKSYYVTIPLDYDDNNKPTESLSIIISRKQYLRLTISSGIQITTTPYGEVIHNNHGVCVASMVDTSKSLVTS